MSIVFIIIKNYDKIMMTGWKLIAQLKIRIIFAH